MSDRIETGPMQFGDDWPGVFIRGDDALGFAGSLQELLQSHPCPNPVHLAVCEGLVKTLYSCNLKLSDHVE